MTAYGSTSDAGLDFTRRLIEAQRVERGLSSADDLRTAARRLVEATERAGCRSVVGASRRAELVVAAATMLDNHISVVDDKSIRAGTVDKVLVVEAVAVTGMYIRDRVQAAREAGATWVAVALLNDLTGPIDTERFGQIDDLVLFD